jgi:hypothetical protein
MQVLRLPELEPEGRSGGEASKTFTFNTPPLQAAGPHTLTADWQESRPGLRVTVVKGPACSIAVTAGPPTEVEVLPLLSHD